MAKQRQRKDTRFSSVEKKDKDEHGVGFLVHKDIVNTVMECCPVSSRLITIRLRAVPFSITLVQVSAPTSDRDDNEIEEFYDQLQNVIDRTPKKNILVVQGDWNATVGRDACGNLQGICGPFSNNDTNERGLRLLEFATFNTAVIETASEILGKHRQKKKLSVTAEILDLCDKRRELRRNDLNLKDLRNART